MGYKEFTKLNIVPFNPDFSGNMQARKFFLRSAAKLSEYKDYRKDVDLHLAFEKERRNLTNNIKVVDQELNAALQVLIDLLKQGWTVQVKENSVFVVRPEMLSLESDCREFIKHQHHAERNEQLRKKPVQEFINFMETKRYWKNGFVSIFSLLRDGRELANKIEAIQSLNNEKDKVEELNKVVQPYLQFVHGDNICDHTGLRLMDIWRYFRHTWTNPYNSVPGRNLLILVRDASTTHHAVIGIAALTSAPVASRVRDKQLGWTCETVYQRLIQDNSTKMAQWLHDVINNSINEVYKEDLFDKVKGPFKSLNDIQKPNPEVIKRLTELSIVDRQKHYRLVQQGDHKTRDDIVPLCDEHWREQAETHLFRSKRQSELAYLLKARIILKTYFSDKITKKDITRFIASKDCKEVIAKVVRKAKGDSVGTSIAELSVCGAIPPYNELLGAKLVSMLVASPETLQEYKNRYGKQPSIIASSIAGKMVIRPAELVYINTTSLYGKRPNQYDRLTMPCQEIIENASGTLRYKYLGKTQGFGTFHFSEHTSRELSNLVSQGKQGQRVNSIFGEGVSPRLRKIREGLSALNFESNHANQLLMHGTFRDSYGIETAENTQDYLLGISKRPKYYLPFRNFKETTRKISEWWIRRWVIKRVQKDKLNERIQQHTLVHPIRHGARVELPRMDVDQDMLFDDH
jgi:hypothetical protein